VPINFSVSDIRDITSRSGNWSKTIQLAGTKNNAKMLNHYYDVNVQAGTFNVNKKQRCNIVQNGVVIMSEAYMQLTNIVKVQNNLTEDDQVTYEVVVRSSSSEFFAEIGQKELTDLNIPEKSHLYNPTNIVASWAHTVNDVYKYVLPWSSDNIYSFKECHPGIYAKVYWDKIHEQSGFTYEWNDLTANDVRFDKLIIPFNGDISTMLSDRVVKDREIVVALTGGQQVFSNTQPAQPNPAFNVITKLLYQVEQVDPPQEWNPATSQWTSSISLQPPDRLEWELEIDFDYKLRNNDPTETTYSTWFPAINSQIPEMGIHFGIINTTTNQVAAGISKFSFNTLNSSLVDVLNNDNTRLVFKYPTVTGAFRFSAGFAPNTTTILASGKATYTLQPSAINIGNILEMRIWNDCQLLEVDFTNQVNAFQDVDIFVDIKAATLKIKYAPEFGIPYNGEVKTTYYIPAKVKQSDFVKSICTMFNLYCESDPFIPNKLIYKRRDDFYDQGRVLDWTYKLARDKEQEIIFIPEELANKKTRFTYRYDQGDPSSKAYFDEVKEVYGQMEYTYNNEWVKNTDVKEIIFSPTINQPTWWGGNFPFFQDTFSPKTGLRILQDGGNLALPTGNGFVIEEYPFSPNNQTVTGTYPFFGHFNRPENPAYDINFGLCDYYSYQVTFPTQNNLFYLNWARTIQNINEGKIFIADFWLTEADMNLFRLSDRIRIDNGYFYVNKIIDYNAGASQLTRVELITMETPAPFGITTPGQLRPYDVKDLDKAIDGIVIDRRPADVIKFRSDANFVRGFRNSLIDMNTRGAQILGRGNQIADSFRGMVIGDNIYADTPGVYVGDWSLSESGVEFKGTMFIDGGYNQVINLNKGNEPDFIDAGENCVRKLGELKSKPFYDGGRK
jgi:hypothetical protein